MPFMVMTMRVVMAMRLMLMMMIVVVVMHVTMVVTMVMVMVVLFEVMTGVYRRINPWRSNRERDRRWRIHSVGLDLQGGPTGMRLATSHRSTSGRLATPFCLFQEGRIG